MNPVDCQFYQYTRIINACNASWPTGVDIYFLGENENREHTQRSKHLIGISCVNVIQLISPDCMRKGRIPNFIM